MNTKEKMNIYLQKEESPIIVAVSDTQNSPFSSSP